MMNKKMNEKLNRFIKGFICTIDFELKIVDEWVFTDKDDKFPLCSGFELMIMFTNKSINKFFGNPIDLETFKKLLSDLRNGEFDVELLD